MRLKVHPAGNGCCASSTPTRLPVPLFSLTLILVVFIVLVPEPRKGQAVELRVQAGTQRS